MIEIRPAIEADVPIMLAMIRQLAIYEKLEHQVVATEQLLRETLFGDRRYAEVLIAWDDQTPIWQALFFHNYSTFLAPPTVYLEDLFVVPEHRGRGAGKALLVQIAKIARERNCGRVEWSVLDWNQPAIDFYKRMGADVMSDWRICRVSGDGIARLADSL